VSKNYDEFDGDDWSERRERKFLKKVRPKDIRGDLEAGLSPKDARRENRDLRKRLARRQRRLSKRDIWEELP
jgi:hypothetical protein